MTERRISSRSMSMVLDAIQSGGTTERLQRVTAGFAGTMPHVRWRYDLSSSKYFPFRYYASALRGSGPEADEVLITSIECFDSHDGKGERLIVSADITGQDGVLLAESPKTEIDVPPEAVVLRNPKGVLGSITKQIEAATEEIGQWIDSQLPTIERALAQV